MFDNKNVMPTYTGKGIDLSAEPRRAKIDPLDIAHALSQQCRFAGHTLSFYSVAEHSVRVSRLFYGEGKRDKELALIALLHDAVEAYLQDIIRPLRVQLTEYADLERKWALRIGSRFGLGDQLADLPQEVMDADLILLATECRDLIRVPKDRQVDLPEPMLERIVRTLTPARARDAFMHRWDELSFS